MTDFASIHSHLELTPELRHRLFAAGSALRVSFSGDGTWLDASGQPVGPPERLAAEQARMFPDARTWVEELERRALSHAPHAPSPRTRRNTATPRGITPAERPPAKKATKKATKKVTKKVAKRATQNRRR